ncbi:MAG: hypothetical protein WC565_03455 [Parcubacteria group bacterium]|jgi:hypothetical protein
MTTRLDLTDIDLFMADNVTTPLDEGRHMVEERASIMAADGVEDADERAKKCVYEYLCRRGPRHVLDALLERDRLIAAGEESAF